MFIKRNEPFRWSVAGTQTNDRLLDDESDSKIQIVAENAAL
jgi:hypothetical protein